MMTPRLSRCWRSPASLRRRLLDHVGRHRFDQSVRLVGAEDGQAQAVTPKQSTVREQWSASAGKAGDYTFRPAVVGNAVFVAAAMAEISKLVDGRREWTINAGQPLSAGVGADSRLVVVATGKGEVLAFAAERRPAAVDCQGFERSPGGAGGRGRRRRRQERRQSGGAARCR
jgi:hypothetical protein